MSQSEVIEVLLVEDNPGDARLVQTMLAEQDMEVFELTHVELLSEALERLVEEVFDVILLDLSLPDTHGVEGMARLQDVNPGVPLVVLTGLDDKALGVAAIQQGAQDYLVKGQVAADLLARSLRYAIERKRTDEALRESEERYRQIVEEASDVVFTTDIEGHCTYVNPPAARLTGYPAEDLIGKHFTSLIPPAWHKRVLAFYQRQFQERLHETTLEFPIATADGEEKWVEQSVSMLTENGQVTGFQSILRDISERKQAEEMLAEERNLLKTILDTALDFIYVKDTEGRHLLTNLAHARSLGKSSVDEVIGAKNGEVHTAEVAERYDVDEQAIIQSGQAIIDKEEFRLDQDGNPLWMSTIKVPLRNQRGKIIGIVGFTRDITERKQAEEIQHEQTRDIAALEERQRLARELHDGVSQSLSAALVIAGVLPKIWKIYPDKGQERVDMLISALREAATEMRTLLIELQPSALEQAEIGELLKQLTASISKRAEVPIELEVNGKRQLSPDMQIALYRITQEALNNAARHADASQMRVSLHRSPQEVELRVSDNGIGFDPANRPAGHFGLGNMHQRAETIGARLDIISQAGQGTEVVVVWKEINGEAVL